MRDLGSIGLGWVLRGPWLCRGLRGLGTRAFPVSLKTVVSCSEKWVREEEGSARAWSKEAALWAEETGSSKEEAGFLMDTLVLRLAGLPGLAGMGTGRSNSQERPGPKHKRCGVIFGVPFSHKAGGAWLPKSSSVWPLCGLPSQEDPGHG